MDLLSQQMLGSGGQPQMPSVGATPSLGQGPGIMQQPQGQGMNPQLMMLLKMLGIGGLSALMQNIGNKQMGGITLPWQGGGAPQAGPVQPPQPSIHHALNNPAAPMPPPYAPPPPREHGPSMRFLQ
jgi:hypothetical protein